MTMKETTIKLLQREDQSFEKDHFDFDFLKKEGLKHISALSGKIWTDHNVHDPGITILEMVSYALMDLGYRTQLPIQDLLASPSGSVDDSYFSPAQILSNNPTTILDYRKLLIEIEGVRNAWLVPFQGEQYSIKYQPARTEECQQYRIECPPIDPTNKDQVIFTLNGLYSICIQKEPYWNIEEEEKLKEKVLDKLHAHRNLCEDFAEVKILCEEEMGICADVEVSNEQDPEEVYVNILIVIEKFLSPNITFFTLQEMLNEKGKLIEEVFEGRPFDPDYNSPGFIDVEELENIPLRKEIHLSDLYNVIGSVEGVESVRNLILNGTTLKGNHSASDAEGDNCGEWIFHIAEDHVPVFSSEKSCITLSRDGSVFQLDSFEIQRLKSQSLKSGSSGRAKGNKSYLDIEIPNGNFRSDLGDYYSIQNEFPDVYGIGEGGLSDSASKNRVAQALQLKGYLLFFDQLLVNYLTQLSNARNLFSFKNSPQQINQNGALDTVPELDKLLQFYNSEQEAVTLLPLSNTDFFKSDNGENIKLGLEFINPLEFNFSGKTYITNNKLSRDVQIEQLARELNQENYTIDIYPTENCFYFVIKPNTLSILLLGRAVFDTPEEAKIAANNIGYIGTKKENFERINCPQVQEYSFELPFSPSTNNTSLVEELTETEQSKLDKRNLFLDHLLARFSESFTDYSLLLFNQLDDKPEASRSVIQAKTNFLTNYPELSGNRGKAFNYRDTEPIWDSENVSGLEKRLFALTGMEDWKKKYLCNFEVHQYQPEYQVVLKYHDKTIFKAKNVYSSFDKGVEVCNAILTEAKNNSFYGKRDLSNCYQIVFQSSKNIEPLSFETKAERDICFNAIRNLFHAEPVDDNTNICPSNSVFIQELKAHSGKVVAKSKDVFTTEDKAVAKELDFIKNIKKQTPLDGFDLSKLELTPKNVNGERISIEKSIVNSSVKISNAEYRWQILGIDQKPILSGTQYFSNQSEAFLNYIKTVFEGNKKWIIKDKVIHLHGQSESVLAEQVITSEAAGKLIKEQADQFLNATKVKKKYLKETGLAYGFEIRNGANRVLVESAVLHQKKNLVKNIVESFKVERYEIKLLDGGESIIEFKDEKGRVIAMTKEPTSDPKSILKQITSNIEKLKIVKKSKTHTFKIIKDNEELLEGFTRYSSASKAYTALFQFMEDFKNERLSFREISEQEIELAEIELYVIDQQGQFLAFSPKENFRKPEYWENETKEIKQTITKLEFPIGYSSESKYYLNDEHGNEFVRSNVYYSNTSSARKAGNNALFAIALLEDIGKQIVFSKSQNAYALSLEDIQSELHFSIQEDRATLENQLECFQNNLLDHSYSVAFSPKPNKWKYQYYWLDEKGVGHTLFQSKKQYNSWDQAKDMYLSFLSSKTELVFEEINKSGKFSFQITYNGEILEHPNTYQSAAEREDVIRQITSMFAFFDSPEADTSCVFLTERSRDNNSYVYRVFKKGNPIAFHPCGCFDLTIQVEELDYKNRLEALCERIYEIPEFYLRGNQLVCQIEGRYHYVLKVKKTNEVCLTSKKSYYSKEQAKEAFEEEYLILIHLASDGNNYLENVLEDGTLEYCLGKSIETALATFSKDTNDNKEEKANMFFSFPIRFKANRIGEKCFEDDIKGYYFHIAGTDLDCEVDWLSTNCYATYAEAWKAFHHFLNLLKNKNNFRTHLKSDLKDWRDDIVTPPPFVKTPQNGSKAAAVVLSPMDNPCCSYITITEVLVESCSEYLNEQCAWGLDDIVATYEPHAFVTLSDACIELEKLSLVNILSDIRVKSKPATSKVAVFYFEIPISVNRNGQVENNYLVGKQHFDGLAQAEEFGEAVVASPQNLELKVMQDDDCLYRIALVRPCEEPKKVKLPNRQIDDECQSNFNTKTGLERFLKAACQDEAFVPCINYDKKDFAYTFKVVDPDTYYVGHHPCQFHTREERDKMITWISTQVKTGNWTFDSYSKSDGKKVVRICFSIKENLTDGEVHLIKAPSEFNPFNVKNELDPTGNGLSFCVFEFVSADISEEQLIVLLQDESHFIPTGDINDANYGIALINPNCVLAKNPQSYSCEEDLWEAIEMTKVHIHTEGMHLVEHILLRPEKMINAGSRAESYDCSCTLLASPDLDCKLPISDEEIDPCLIPEGQSEDYAPTYVPGADPYSFLATTIFPCWSKRYKDQNFRTFVTNTLLREAPAHIAINQLWVSPKQLCKFEDRYRKWLRHKAELDNCEDTNMPCDLIECITELRNCCTKLQEEESQDCECGDEEVKLNIHGIAMNSMFNYSRNYSNPILESRLRYLPSIGNQLVLGKNKFKEFILEYPSLDIDVLAFSKSVEPVAKATAKEAKKPSSKKEATPIDSTKEATTPSTAKIPKSKSKPGVKTGKKTSTPKAKAIEKKETPTPNKVTSKVRPVAKPKALAPRPFISNVQSVKDNTILRTKTYAHILAYAEKVASKKVTKVLIKELSDKIITFSLRYTIGRKGGGEDKFYIALIADAIALTLDKLVEQNKEKLLFEKELSSVFSKLKEKDISLALIKKHWNAKVLKAKIKDAPVIDLYLKLIE